MSGVISASGGAPVAEHVSGGRTTSAGLSTTSEGIVTPVCGRCGNPLIPKTRGSGNDKRFCSAPCRVAASRSRRKMARQRTHAVQELAHEAIA